MIEPVARRSEALAVGHIDADLVEFGRLHLRSDGALPDQLVSRRWSC